MDRNERGTALVETALIAPLLLLLIFGTVEWGFVFRDSLTVANSARAGARAAASAGNDPLADLRVIRAVEGASGTLEGIEKIVVFKANSASSSVPAACKASTTGVDGLCNVYTADDIANLDNASGDSDGDGIDDADDNDDDNDGIDDADDNDDDGDGIPDSEDGHDHEGDRGDDASGSFEDPTYNLDDHWPATSRVSSVRSSKGPDWVGIWVSAPHSPVMSSILGKKSLTDCVVMRLEPTV